MDLRYAIVYMVPKYSGSVIEAAYRRVTGRPLTVTNLHISLGFSFNLTGGHGEKWLLTSLQKVKFKPISAYVTVPALFEQQGKQILYLTVEPYDELMGLHKKINKAFGRGVKIDSSVFDGDKLPDFWPHITLDYDFDGDRYTFAGLEREQMKLYFEIQHLTVIRMGVGGWEKLEARS